jgi:hypothetical protein
MLYDTRIIEDNTFDDLVNLMNTYQFSITNDQGVIALYYTNIKKYFKQITTRNDNTCFYDYLRRNSNDNYIMLKMA